MTLYNIFIVIFIIVVFVVFYLSLCTYVCDCVYSFLFTDNKIDRLIDKHSYVLFTRMYRAGTDHRTAS